MVHYLFAKEKLSPLTVAIGRKRSKIFTGSSLTVKQQDLRCVLHKSSSTCHSFKTNEGTSIGRTSRAYGCTVTETLALTRISVTDGQAVSFIHIARDFTV